MYIYTCTLTGAVYDSKEGWSRCQECKAFLTRAGVVGCGLRAVARAWARVSVGLGALHGSVWLTVQALSQHLQLHLGPQAGWTQLAPALHLPPCLRPGYVEAVVQLAQLGTGQRCMSRMQLKVPGWARAMNQCTQPSQHPRLRPSSNNKGTALPRASQYLLQPCPFTHTHAHADTSLDPVTPRFLPI